MSAAPLRWVSFAFLAPDGRLRPAWRALVFVFGYVALVALGFAGVIGVFGDQWLGPYREMALLANGFIHKLESVNSFVACHHPNAAQHSAPFLICDACHKAVELEDEHVVTTLDAQARALGFSPQTQTLEVHGLCADCAQLPPR